MSEEVTAQAIGPGSTIGPWKVLHRLDSGSYGVVFLVERAGHPEAGLFALKLAKQPWDERFEREAQLLQRCQHPSIPRYEDMGVWTGPKNRRYPYIVMECVEGFTLYDWAREEQRSNLEVLQVLVQLVGALASAHARGIVHRDVKGDNIRVTPEGRAVLLDWGSCWMPSARPLTDSPAPPGTSAYRPPEQRDFIYRFRKDTEARWESRPSDDLYALGVTLYRLVTGTYLPPCTDGDGLVEREVPRPSERATVSPALESIIMRLISDAHAARGTAEQLVREAMALVQAGEPDAEKLIVPTESALPTESGPGGRNSSASLSSDGQDDEPVSGESDTELSRHASSWEARQPPEAVPAWLAWAGASMMGGLVMALVVLLVRPTSQEPARQPNPWIATPKEIAQFAPDAGVGDEALASVQTVPSAAVPLHVMALPMPKGPLPGQRRPPCDPDSELVALGVCWTILVKKPPCGNSGYEIDSRCVIASVPEPRQPTSGEP